MCKNPSITISSIRFYIYNCKFITSIYQSQQNNRKTVFVIEKLGTAIWRALNLHVFFVDSTNALTVDKLLVSPQVILLLGRCYSSFSNLFQSSEVVI